MDDVRLIDGNAIVEKLKSYYEALSPDVQSELIRRDEVSSCIAELINAPTIDAQPVKHGTWITTQKTIDDGITTCSYCHRDFYIDDLVTVGNEDGFCEFCPACGSDNRGDAEVSK